MIERNDPFGKNQPIPIREHHGGFVAEGPGFYIWDEDPTEVMRAARDIGAGRFDAKPTTRLLVIRDDFEEEPAD
jgi:hypothetical protein